MKAKSIDNFYDEISVGTGRELDELLPSGISKNIGHFNVFSIADIYAGFKKEGKMSMPYSRRDYYKISLIRGSNRAEYADKTIDIEKNALLFATPRIPYHYTPNDWEQAGHFCIFSAEFLTKAKSGIQLDELPIFKSGGYPVFQLTEKDIDELESIFLKMHRELASDYPYKYDLIRNYVMELIHYGQKLQPATAQHPAYDGSARVSSLFIELLERQFPIESSHQTISLRTPKDYASRLSVHVNYLNRVLKENTGKTTSNIIAARIAQEAKILLRQTKWNISEIAYCLGYEEVAHFSNFFKKQTGLPPLAFRTQ